MHTQNILQNIKWLNICSLKKMENSRFRCVLLDNYYLLINKKYLNYIKRHLKSFAQKLCNCMFQRFKMADILALK